MDYSLLGSSLHGMLHGLLPARLLCSWNSPGKDTGVGCHSLLQGIFQTQGLILGLLHCRQIVYRLSHQGSPVTYEAICDPSTSLCTCPPPFKNIYLFIYITATSLIQGRHDLVVARSMWDLSSPARDWTCIAPIARQVVNHWTTREVAAAAKSLQSCPTLCDPIDGSPPGSPIPGILQARTLEWVAISFSNAWKWKVKGKSLSCVGLFGTPWTVAYQAPLSMGFSRQEYWSGVPLLLQGIFLTQGSNLGLPLNRQILYCLSHQGSSNYAPAFSQPH